MDYIIVEYKSVYPSIYISIHLYSVVVCSSIVSQRLKLPIMRMCFGAGSVCLSGHILMFVQLGLMYFLIIDAHKP